MESVTQVKGSVSILGDKNFFWVKTWTAKIYFFKRALIFYEKCSAGVIASFCVFVLVDKRDNILNKLQQTALVFRIASNIALPKNKMRGKGEGGAYSRRALVC